jgi:hypothetical protein
MAAELGGDVVTEAEFEVLRSGRKRRKIVRRTKRKNGKPMARLVKRLMREQMNLALFHGKVEEEGHPAVEAQREKIRELKGLLAAPLAGRAH